MWRKKKLIDNFELEREKIIALDKFNEAFKKMDFILFMEKELLTLKI